MYIIQSSLWKLIKIFYTLVLHVYNYLLSYVLKNLTTHQNLLFILLFSYFVNYILHKILTLKMAATFGKGGKYCKNQELSKQVHLAASTSLVL
jgi:hypothetical protein